VTFDVPALAYDRFMGRYSRQLSAQLAGLAGVEHGQRALDVGCGPGALTEELVARLGADAVAAADPSPSFVAAARERFPGVRVEQAPAEALPFADGEFDAALAQLVVHFMRDPVGGVREMARVTRAGGVVAACGWDLAGNTSPLTPFWDGVHDVRPDAPDESGFAGAGEGQLPAIFTAAGLDDVRETTLPVVVEHQSFEEWWEPYTLGVGPAGAFVAQLEPEEREEIREACRRRFGGGPIRVAAQAWAAVGRVGGT
jgi:SAM-dependent methyltransferase